ncbi:hypothetical protein GCM10009800_48920 [Nocardiopsis rhodophaea]
MGAGAGFDVLLIIGEQVEEQRSQATLVERGGHRLLPRAVPGAAASMREEDHPGRPSWNSQITGELDIRRPEGHGFRLRHHSPRLAMSGRAGAAVAPPPSDARGSRVPRLLFVLSL